MTMFACLIKQTLVAKELKETLNYLKINAHILNKIHTDSKYRELNLNQINWGK